VIAKKLQEVSGMAITTHRAAPLDQEEEEATTAPAAPKTFKANFKVVGIDGPGLVYEVTELFYRHGCRVERLNTETQLAAFGGTELFIMDGQIVNDHPVDMDELKAAAFKLELDRAVEFEITMENDDVEQAAVTRADGRKGEWCEPVAVFRRPVSRSTSYMKRWAY